MKYSVKLNGSGRHILWCDKNWFETAESPLYIFSEEEAKSTALQLRKHYIFNVSLVPEKGEEIPFVVAPKPVDNTKEMNYREEIKSIFHSKLKRH